MIILIINTFVHFKNRNNIQNLRCPGYYCGRRELGNGLTSDCGSCPSGTRVNVNLSYICQPCTDTPSPYDLMYLLFMAAVPLLFHAVYIDLSLSSISWASQVKRYQFRLLILSIYFYFKTIM